MKKIHLLRHAKSSWENELLADIDRPLNHRGIKACAIMAPHINKAGLEFAHIFCSPAVRAQSTIELISRHLPNNSIQWQTEDALYCFDSSELLKWCRSLDESISDVLIVGHNPALTDLCNVLSITNTNIPVKNIPTCGYTKLEANSECDWQDVSANSFVLTNFIRPKTFAFD